MPSTSMCLSVILQHQFVAVIRIFLGNSLTCVYTLSATLCLHMCLINVQMSHIPFLVAADNDPISGWCFVVLWNGELTCYQVDYML